ncbi:MAG: hypothetical protein HC821_02000 [Lewinella sp.]|nr:hypothetical protein [Lewinella sp.]
MAQTTLGAQSAADLKNKRQRLLRELQTTTTQLEATKAERSQAVRQLNLLQQQLSKGESLSLPLTRKLN